MHAKIKIFNKITKTCFLRALGFINGRHKCQQLSDLSLLAGISEGPSYKKKSETTYHM